MGREREGTCRLKKSNKSCRCSRDEQNFPRNVLIFKSRFISDVVRNSSSACSLCVCVCVLLCP